MADAKLDARQEGDSYRGIEVITGKQRRRRWTAEEKARIVTESFEEGANISEVARRNGVARGLLTVWREKLSTAAAASPLGFVPIRIGAETPLPADRPVPISACPTRLRPGGVASAASGPAGGIEIEVSGARIRVEIGVDARTLATVLLALRGGG